MRRILIGVASAAAALALVACGGDNGGGTDSLADGSPPSPTLNGLESKTGPEVMRAAADALRKADSVHVKAKGDDVLFDLRLVTPNGVTGTLAAEGIEADLVRDLEGKTYVRYGDKVPPEAEGQIEPHQWYDATESGEFDDITITSIADELASDADTAKPGVERTTEAGQPALLIESTDGDKLWVSNVGEPWPLRQVDENGTDGTFSEYNAQVDLEPPPAGEVRKPNPAAN